MYNKTGGVVRKDGVVYKAVWAPGTLAEELLSQRANFRLPEADSTSPGFLIDGDSITPLTPEDVAKITAEAFPDAAYWEKLEADLDAEYEQEAAEAVATSAFQALEVVADSGEARKYYLKAPRSEQEIRNLIAVGGLPGLVQLLGRTEDKLALSYAGLSITQTMYKLQLERSDATNLSLAIQLADAFSALHKLGIHHRDLTTHNVLIRADQSTATLCDLESGPTTGYVKAPEELLNGEGAFTDKADVFPFGLLLWSLENNNMPRPFVSRFLDRTGQFASLMEQCLAVDPSERPAIAQVASQLRALS
jgi:hypothetical protein